MNLEVSSKLNISMILQNWVIIIKKSILFYTKIKLNFIFNSMVLGVRLGFCYRSPLWRCLKDHTISFHRPWNSLIPGQNLLLAVLFVQASIHINSSSTVLLSFSGSGIPISFNNILRSHSEDQTLLWLLESKWGSGLTGTINNSLCSAFASIPRGVSLHLSQEQSTVTARWTASEGIRSTL